MTALSHRLIVWIVRLYITRPALPIPSWVIARLCRAMAKDYEFDDIDLKWKTKTKGNRNEAEKP